MERVALGRPVRGKTLSPREQDVLWWWARGLRVAEVAARLGVSAGTVKTHLAGVYGKLGVHGRAAAAAWAVRGEGPPRVRSTGRGAEEGAR